MIAYAVLNEESLSTGDPGGDSSLLLALFKTFQALRGAVTVAEQASISPYLTKAVHEISMPSGAKLVGALSAFSRISKGEADRLRDILQKAVAPFDEEGKNTGPVGATEVTFGDTDEPREVPSLRAAWVLRGLAWSAAHSAWQIDAIPILVRDAPGDFRKEILANAYRPELGPRQRAVLARSLTVLPDFADEDHRHDPTHTDYLEKKSHIPRHARRILTYAVPTDGGATWWAQCACTYYHRFMGNQQQKEPGRVRVHWNGTTNPNATGNRQKGTAPTTAAQVPPDVKKRLADNAAIRSLGDGDCGCRELK